MFILCENQMISLTLVATVSVECSVVWVYVNYNVDESWLDSGFGYGAETLNCDKFFEIGLAS